MPGLLARLDAAARERLKSAYAPKSQGPLGSALSLLARFADSCPERDLFVRPLFRGDIEASAHNEWTLILIVWFAVTEPSPTTGKPLAVDSIRSYVSLLKGYLSHSYAFDVVDRTTRLSSLLKDLSVEQPLGGVRKKRRGFRRRHLRRLWERSASSVVPCASTRSTAISSFLAFASHNVESQKAESAPTDHSAQRTQITVTSWDTVR